MPTGPGWAFEVKFDGVRAIGYTDTGRLRLVSRNDRDITSSYPEIGAISLDDGLVVDGELVAADERGRPDFSRLQHRMHVTAPTAHLLAEVPVRYVVFDVLRHHGELVVGRPYHERRALLTGLDLDERTGARVRVPPNFTNTPGPTVLAAADGQGLEGVVGKRVDSVYLPGRRSRSWIKTAIRHTQEVVIVGWAAGSGSRTNSLGALLLAAYDDRGELVYVGDVGTGFTDAARRHLLDQLHVLERDRSPFVGEFTRARGWPGRPPSRTPVRWVQPQLVGEIEYRAFTPDGSFRHPSWRGLRPNRDPRDVQLPTPD